MSDPNASANAIYGQVGNLSFGDILQYGALRAIDSNLGSAPSPTSANAPASQTQVTAAPYQAAKQVPTPTSSLGNGMGNFGAWISDHQKELFIGFGGLLAVGVVLKVTGHA